MKLPVLHKTAVITVLTLLGALSVPATQANEFAQLQLQAGVQDNVTRALHVEDQIESAFARLQFSAGKLFQLGLNDMVTVSANLANENHFRWTGFDQLEAGVGLRLQHKFGFGAYAPRLSLQGTLTKQFYRGRARDNAFSSLSLGLEKRLTSSLLLAMELGSLQNSSPALPDDPRVTAFGYSPDIRLPYELYDFDSQSVSLFAEYTLQNNFLVSASFGRSNGATISSTQSPLLKTYKVSSAFYSDPAFADGWFAYRIDTQTNDWGLAVSVPLAQDRAVDVAARYFDIDGRGGRGYKNSLITVTFTQNF